jgi:hypothetical protein
MMLNEKQSYVVRKYFIQIEKDYLRALQQTESENKHEYEALCLKLQEANAAIDGIRARHNHTCAERDELIVTAAMATRRRDQIEHLSEYIMEDAFASSGDPEYKWYLAMLGNVALCIPVYCIKPDDNDADAGVSTDDSYNEYAGDAGLVNEAMCVYRLYAPKKGDYRPTKADPAQYAGALHVIDKVHYDDFIKRINKYAIKKSLYKASLNMLREMTMPHINALLRNKAL